MSDQATGIELAALVVPERGEAVLLSLLLDTVAPDGGAVLHLGNWRTPPDHDDDPDDEPGEPPGLVGPERPVVLAAVDLDRMIGLAERAVAAVPTTVLDADGWALLGEDGELIATLVRVPTGELQLSLPPPGNERRCSTR